MRRGGRLTRVAVCDVDSDGVAVPVGVVEGVWA